MLKGIKWRLLNEFGGDAGGDGGGGLDIAAAVDQIGADLGFGGGKDDEPGNGGNADDPAAGDNGAPRPGTSAPSPAPTPAPTSAPAPSPTPAPAPTSAPAPGTPRFTADAPPTTWKPAVAQHWAQMPLEVRQEIARRESDMFTGLEQYKQDAGFAKEVKSFLSPVMPALAQHNIPPHQFLGNLVNAHLTLANDAMPAEQKAEFVTTLLRSYGIELNPKPPGEEGYVDPQVKSLQEKITSLESRLNGADTSRANEFRAEKQRELDAFVADPAHPHFDAVADDIAALIRGSGGKMSLKDAYEKAVWANPATRALEVAKAQTAATEKAAKEARERAEAANKARQGRVRTNGHQGNGTVVTGSMEDTMAETLASIRKKSS